MLEWVVKLVQIGLPSQLGWEASFPEIPLAKAV